MFVAHHNIIGNGYKTFYVDACYIAFYHYSAILSAAFDGFSR